MLKNLNNDSKNNLNCKVILTIMSLLMISGFILIFIKPLIGVIFIAVAGCLNLYLHKNNPDFIKSLSNTQQKTHAGAWVKKFDVKHIQGINFIDFEQPLKCKVQNGTVVFYDSEKIIFNIDSCKIENLMVLEELEQTQKNKSVLARAVVGGLILGGVGAVVGGISGACPTLKTSKKYFLEISIPGPEKIILTSDNQTLKKLKIAIAESIKL